ncbi:MAG: aminotransferase class IV [Weeksellaceae bacterium]
MSLDKCLINGKVVSIGEAQISLTDAEFVYGFGVYETVKIRNRIIYFLDHHIERLLDSAQQINLQHTFTTVQMTQFVTDLNQELDEQSYNLKIYLYGGKAAKLVMLPSAPLYPDRKWYKTGVAVISVQHERWMPQAKTLNMLPSYYYYAQAKAKNAYDTVLIDSEGYLIEGTRTNLYFMQGKTIFIPPMHDVLEGVTLMTILKVAKRNGYTIVEKKVSYDQAREYESMFLSSTSTKIMPIKQLDENITFIISDELKELMKLYEAALELSKGIYEQV